MNYPEAHTLLIDGGKVRRQAWPHKRRWLIVKTDRHGREAISDVMQGFTRPGKPVNVVERRWMAQSDDLLANDWIAYVEEAAAPELAAVPAEG